MELSIARDFLEKHDQECVTKETEDRQRKINHQPSEKLPKPLATEHFIIVTEFNIYFGYPRSDTCDTCDPIEKNGRS